MEKEITELDMDKYLVVKRDDLERYFSQFTKGVFTTEQEGKYIDSIPFNLVLEEIQNQREAEGKPQNKYLVLNLDDEIDQNHLIRKLNLTPTTPPLKVKDIAVALVNAILKTKEK